MASPPHTHRMKKRDFLQLDVFASEPGRGNPLAVVLDAADLDSAAMQAIAAWLNLSETTFVLPPTQAGADYRLRIFTPRQELPFAGHPSVGTAHAVLERGLVTPRDGRLVQECGAGLLPIRVDGEGRATPSARPRPPRRRAPRRPGRDPFEPAHRAPRRLAPRHHRQRSALVVHRTRDEAAVRTLVPDLRAMARASVATDAVGVAVFARCTGQSYALVVRAFVPADGIPEDPVTGSANAAISAWLHANGALPAQSFLVFTGPRSRSRRHRRMRRGRRGRRLDRRPDADRRRGRASLVNRAAASRHVRLESPPPITVHTAHFVAIHRRTGNLESRCRISTP